MVMHWLTKLRKGKGAQAKTQQAADSLRAHKASKIGVPLGDVSPGARFVCEQLQAAGHDGYLVGGCVRDWLLGKHPKDFDVVTDVPPERVARLFNRARVIGRRFKIVHVRYQREVIEVATYREAPDESSEHNITRTSGSGRLLRDNLYGTLETDAARRDFTVNAMYLDPINDVLLEYDHGLQDCQDKILRVIGDPEQRFREDPVRMLRAIRFQAKLGFDLEPGVEQLIKNRFRLMKEVSNARMFDETFKLFHHAHAVRSWEQLGKFDALKVLFPATYRELETGDEAVNRFIMRAMQNTDARVAKNKPVIPAFFFAVLLWYPFQRLRQQNTQLTGREGVYRAASRIIQEQYPVIAIPKRVSTIMTEIWDMQWALEQRRPKQVLRILEERRFRAAYDFLLLRAYVGEIDRSLTDWWTRIQDADEAEQAAMIRSVPGQGGRRRTRRPRRKKKPAS